MSLELVNTFATLGTFLVIAATAIAAIVQLRHMRGGNQIAAFAELRHSNQTPEFIQALHCVFAELPDKMEDPAFRYQVAHKPARTAENEVHISRAEAVGDFFETMGIFAKTGLVDRSLLMDTYAPFAVQVWNALADLTACFRVRQGSTIYENFEYLVVLAQDWQAAHKFGTYPRNMRRIDVPNKWLEADAKYAASLGTA